MPVCSGMARRYCDHAPDNDWCGVFDIAIDSLVCAIVATRKSSKLGFRNAFHNAPREFSSPPEVQTLRAFHQYGDLQSGWLVQQTMIELFVPLPTDLLAQEINENAPNLTAPCLST